MYKNGPWRDLVDLCRVGFVGIPDAWQGRI
jgi:hypothetical protein